MIIIDPDKNFREPPVAPVACGQLAQGQDNSPTSSATPPENPLAHPSNFFLSSAPPGAIALDEDALYRGVEGLFGRGLES